MIESIIQAGLEYGADFVDIFKEETRRASLSLRDQKIESAAAGIDFGYGIRLIFGTQVLYLQTSRESEDHVLRLLKELMTAHGKSLKENSGQNVQYRDIEEANLHKVQLRPSELGQEKKTDWLQRADLAAREISSKIKQVSTSAMDVSSHVLIANSEGLKIEDERVRCRMSIGTTAAEGGDMFTASESPGVMAGFEFFENLDIEFYAERAANRAVKMLSSGYVEGKKMPVIIGSGFGGVIFHEACGHPLETESIRKNASPFVGKLGQQIAHPSLTAIDDGRMPGIWGSINIDDEGMKTERTVLIEKGVLKNYLSDRVGAQQLNVRRTGSARRESFRYAPVSRMRNTFIDKGNDSFDEMLASTGDGLYAKVLGGGSVNPATGEFNFSVQEGYLVKKGKVTDPVRGATLIGKGHEILPKISMVGKDLDLAAGICGASSGAVPVTVGQPTLKVDEILVGGRS